MDSRYSSITTPPFDHPAFIRGLAQFANTPPNSPSPFSADQSHIRMHQVASSIVFAGQGPISNLEVGVQHMTLSPEQTPAQINRFTAEELASMNLSLVNFEDYLPDLRYHMTSTHSAPRFYKCSIQLNSLHTFIGTLPNRITSALIQEAGEAQSVLNYTVSDRENKTFTLAVQLTKGDDERTIIPKSLKHHRLDSHATKIVPSSDNPPTLRFAFEILHKGGPFHVKISICALQEVPGFPAVEAESPPFFAGTSSKPPKDVMNTLFGRQISAPPAGPIRSNLYPQVDRYSPYPHSPSGLDHPNFQVDRYSRFPHNSPSDQDHPGHQEIPMGQNPLPTAQGMSLSMNSLDAIDPCAICFKNRQISLGDVGALGCGHSFHLNCLNKIQEANQICPSCRLPFSKAHILKLF